MKTKSKRKVVNVISLGCSKNLVDSEIIMGQLRNNNIEVRFEDWQNNSDAVVINTCGFIHDAKEESVNAIMDFVKAKNSGKTGKVYVMGCLSQRYKDELSKEIPEVDKFFGVNDFKEIINEIGGRYRKELVGERVLTTPSHYAYLKIAEGCDRRCSFCAIPAIRGKHSSRTMDSIIQEAKALVSKGIKEIILISQDLTYYGIDLYGKQMLTQLVDRLSAIEGLHWLRLHYLYPSSFPEDILKVMNERENICNYIDIPFQHINDRILKSMRRGHNSKEIYSLIETIRKEVNNVALRTSLIAGYPGETEREFKELVNFIKETQFDRLGIFAYSHEEGTVAGKLTDDIPQEIKDERVDELMSIQENISYNINRKKIGQTVTTLIDRKEDNYFTGRTQFDSPEIDNEVIITSPPPHTATGCFVQVKISDADSFDLTGSII